jgi:hypothetical protein
MRRILIAGCVLLVVSASVAASRAGDYGDYIARVDRAIQAGDSLTGMDLICEWNRGGDALEYGRTHQDEMLAALSRWQTFQRDRYLAVFRPPAPVESYFAPGMSWEEWAAFGGVHGSDAGEQYDDSLLVISDSAATVTVDLDRDRNPEMIYRGEVPYFNSAMTVVHDDAGDGRRQQWLAAPAGADPRSAAAIWLYRDGPAISVIVKPAMGSPCGRSWCFGRGL